MRTIAFIVTVAVALGLHFLRRKRNPRNLPLPPGPVGLPLLGCVFNVSNAGSHKTYTDWKIRYGPIAHFTMLTRDVVILNTREVANELLDKRSALYADRPRQVMCGELMSWDRGIALCPAGPRHKKHRKLVNTTLSPNASKRLWPVQERAARDFTLVLCRNNLQRPNGLRDEDKSNFLDLLRRSVGRNVVGIIFGSEVNAAASGRSITYGLTKPEIDDYIYHAEKAHELFTKTLSSFAYAVDWIPWLKYVPECTPFADFKREAREARLDLEKLTMDPFLKARERIASYLDSCFAITKDRTSMDEDSFAWTAMAAYTGGSDTTIASLMTVFLAAALHPEAQALFQAELNAVVGQDRLPTVEDRASLPYVTAFVNECLRSIPIAPLGVPHRAMEDDTLDGYYIPEGSTIIANIWGMLHDPEVYASPMTFDPTRFLPKEGIPTLPDIRGREEPEVGSLPFGFGRRICPGMHLAKSGVWIYAATVLWAFRVKLREGAAHSEKKMTWDSVPLSEEGILYPLPFEVELESRSESMLRVLAEGV
ncbi:cytochrome P450 [Phlebopus sp. FC_14]|nr:cytochrome P450 [Phlebopus sp. FC_14]